MQTLKAKAKLALRMHAKSVERFELGLRCFSLNLKYINLGKEPGRARLSSVFAKEDVGICRFLTVPSFRVVVDTSHIYSITTVQDFIHLFYCLVLCVPP